MKACDVLAAAKLIMGNGGCRRCAEKDLTIDMLADSLQTAINRLADTGNETLQFERDLEGARAQIDRDEDGLPVFYSILSEGR